jgi:multiple sugar transport system permease protein
MFLLPLSIFLTVMTVFPTIFLFAISFTNKDATNPKTKFIGLGNYIDNFKDTQFLISLFLSLIVTSISVSIQLTLGFLAALSISNFKKDHNVLKGLLLIPMAAAPVAILFNWRFMLNASSGIVNYVLTKMGLPAVDWLGSKVNGIISIIMVETWMWTPFIFVILLGAISAIPSEISDAAKIDGANRLKMITAIIIPLISPFILIAVIMRVIDSLKSFDSIEILTSGGPGYDTVTLNYLLYLDGIKFLRFGHAASLTVLLLIVLTIIARFFFKQLLKVEDTVG